VVARQTFGIAECEARALLEQGRRGERTSRPNLRRAVRLR
jgi:hypothetical protein